MPSTIPNQNALGVPGAQRNANSGLPGGGNQTTAPVTIPPTGAVPISVLAQSLASHFESQAGDLPQSQVPSATNADPNAAPELDDAAPTEIPEPANEPNENVPEPNELAPADPEEGEPHENEPPPAPNDVPVTEENPGVQKRIGQLLAKVRDLETKLSEQAEAQPEQRRGAASGDAAYNVDRVTSAAELDRRAEQAEMAIEEVETLLAKLPVAPQRVEDYLRTHGVGVKNAAGEDDFSPENMAEFLTEARQGFRATLRAIPKRRAWLDQFKTAHAQVVTVKPWLNDLEDERRQLMDQVIREHPTLKSQPNWEYWVACAVEGHLATQAGMKRNGNGSGNGNGNGKPPVARPPARPALPNTGTNGAARSAPRVRPDQAKLNAARQAVQTDGNARALSRFMENSGLLQ